MGPLMNKGMTQSQWLNIVIIIISALILAFTLIGRFMDRAVDDSDARQIVAEDSRHQISEPTMQLTSIDFGTLRIFLKPQEAHSKLALIGSVEPKGALTEKQIKALIERWQKILMMPAQSLSQASSINYLPIATILLYFAETAQPIVAKVTASDKIESTPLISVRFVSTGQQIIIDNLPIDQLLPQQVLQKPASEKKSSIPVDLQGSD